MVFRREMLSSSKKLPVIGRVFILFILLFMIALTLDPDSLKLGFW